MERATVVRAKVAEAANGEEEPCDKKTADVPGSFKSESIFLFERTKGEGQTTHNM